MTFACPAFFLLSPTICTLSMPTSCLNSVTKALTNVTFQEYIKNRSHLRHSFYLFRLFEFSYRKMPIFPSLKDAPWTPPFARFTLLEPWRMTAQQLWHCYVVQNYRTSSDVGLWGLWPVFLLKQGLQEPVIVANVALFLKENYHNFPKHRKQVDIGNSGDVFKSQNSPLESPPFTTLWKVTWGQGFCSLVK